MDAAVDRLGASARRARSSQAAWSVVLILAFLESAGQSNALAMSGLPADIVAIKVEGPEDAGAVPPGEPVRRVLHLTNTTSSPVEWRVVASTCACIQIEPPTGSIRPGEPGRITVGTTAIEAGGQQRHAVQFEFGVRGEDGLLSSRQDYTVAFAYTPDIEVSVQPTFLTTHAYAGEEALVDLYVRRPDGSRPEVLQFRPPGDWCSLVRVEPSPEQPSLSILKVRLDTSRPGVLRGMSGIRVRGEAEIRNHIDTSIRVDPALRASPPGIVLVGSRERTPMTSAVRLSPVGKVMPPAPARLRWSDTIPGVSVGEIEMVDDGWRLAVTCDPVRLFAQREIGRTSLAVEDGRGNVLVELPLVWFSRDALDGLRPSRVPR